MCTICRKFFIVSVVYSFVLTTTLLFTALFWICYLVIQYKVYVSCIICMNYALFFIVHFIELVRMSDLSYLIDKLDDDGVLHLADFTTVCGSRSAGA